MTPRPFGDSKSIAAARAASPEPEHRRHAANKTSLTTRLLGAVARATTVMVVDAGIRLVLFFTGVVASVAARALTTTGGANVVLATARAGRATDEVIVTVTQATAHESEAAHAVGEVFGVGSTSAGTTVSRLIDLGRYDHVSEGSLGQR